MLLLVSKTSIISTTSTLINLSELEILGLANEKIKKVGSIKFDAEVQNYIGFNKVISNEEEEIILDVDEIDVKELLEQLKKSNDELKEFMLPDVED